MLKLAIFASILVVVSASHQQQFETVFQWNFVQYNWPSTDDMTAALENGEYIPKNNVPSGIKVWANKMYLTVPRLMNGVPVALAVTSATPQNGDTAPNLDPYPSWEMQTLGDCEAFQYVQSTEIDLLGRMWVIDTGRTETMTENPVTRCPPRLIILDLEDGGKILRTYEFPNEVAPIGTVVLNDIVLDHMDGGWAYIADSQDADPGIIVYSLKDNTSWKIKHASMKPQEEALNLEVAGISISVSMGVDGIALSPPGPNRLVYYSPVTSFHLYSIPVSVLQDSSIENVDSYVVDLGRKNSQADGMVMSNQGSLYFGLLADDSIASWDSKISSSFTEDLKVIHTDHVNSQWPDAFFIDGDARLWYVANAAQRLFSDTVDITEPNFTIIRGTIDAKSYQYSEDGTIPELPAISSGN